MNKSVVLDTNIYYSLMQDANKKSNFETWLSSGNYIHYANSVSIFELMDVSENNISQKEKKNSALQSLKYIHDYCDFSLPSIHSIVIIAIKRFLKIPISNFESSDFKSELHNYLFPDDITLKYAIIENMQNVRKRAAVFTNELLTSLSPNPTDASDVEKIKISLKKNRSNRKLFEEALIADKKTMDLYKETFLSGFMGVDKDIVGKVLTHDDPFLFLELLINYYIVLISDYSIEGKKSQANDREDWLLLIYFNHANFFLTGDKKFHNKCMRAIENMETHFKRTLQNIKSRILLIDDSFNLPTL